MTESAENEKPTSEWDSGCSERSKPPKQPDIETDNNDDSNRSSWGSLSRTQDGNRSRQADGWGAPCNKISGDSSRLTDGWGAHISMNNRDGTMNRPTDGWDTSLRKVDGDGKVNGRTTGWRTALQRTDGRDNINGQTNGWGTTFNKTDGKGSMNRHDNGWSRALKKKDGGGDVNRPADGWGTALNKTGGWGSSVSPGLDAWRQHSPTISPKEGCSRSRSGRSRSPYHGSKCESESWDRRGRMGASETSQLCRYHAAGMCRRGSQCKFVHDDAGEMHPDDGPQDCRGNRFKRGRYARHGDGEKITDLWEQTDRSGDRFSQRAVSHMDTDYEKHGWRHGSHCRDVYEKHSQWHGSQYDGDYEKHAKRNGSLRDGDYEKHSQSHGCRYDGNHCNHEQNRTSSRPTIICYAFTKGSCQRGSACRFAHIDASPDDQCLMKDDAKEKIHGRRDADASFRQRLEPHRTRYTSCEYSAEGRCRRGDCNSCRQYKPNDRSKDRLYEDRLADNLDTDINPSWNVSNCGNQGIDNSSSRSGRKWCDRRTTANPSDSSVFRHDDYDARGTAASMEREGSIQKPEHPQSLQGVPQTAFCLQDQCNISTTSSIPSQILGQGQQSKTTVSESQNHTLDIQNQEVIPPLSSTGGVQQSLDTENSNFTGHSRQNHLSSPIGQREQNLNPSKQSWESLPQLLYSNGQGHQVNLQHYSPSQNMQNKGEELVSKTDKSAMSPSQLRSDTLITKVAVHRVAEIKNIPASLPCRNGQQLPQLHSSFNPTGGSGLELSQPFSNLNSGRSVTSVVSDASNLPPEFSLKSSETKDQTKEELKTNLMSLDQLPVESDNDKSNKDSDLEYHQLQGNTESKTVELSGFPESKEVKETEPGETEQSNQLEDVHAAVHTEGVVTRSKDEKGLKAFKFALAEFVKNILKPTWREGSLSKEAHKTIVKKVVDKVTGTLQGPNIPDTKEKIDIYLSFAKTKIENLVQAYVERYVKTSALA